jgi:O-antigen/teichoic acid export membrane protein
VSDSGRKESLIVLTDQIFVSGSNFLTTVMLATYLAPEEFGGFVLAWGVLLFLNGIQMALIVSPMQVRGPRLSRDESALYYDRVLQVALMFGLACVGLIAISGILLSLSIPGWTLGAVVVPLSVAALFVLSQDYLRRYFLTIRRTRSALFNDLCTHGLRLCGLFTLGTMITMDATSALWVVSAASAVGLFIGIFQHEGVMRLKVTQLRTFASVAFQHWDFGKWLVANNVAYWFGSQSVLYVVAVVLSVSAVGALNATLNVLGAANILFLSMETLMPVRAASAYERFGQAGLDAYLRRALVLGSLVTIGLAVIAGMWSEQWLRILYGETYRGYGWVIWWWGGYYLLGMLQRPTISALRVLGDTRSIYLASSTGALATMVLAYPVTKAYGLGGAMIVLCLTQCLVLCSLRIRYTYTAVGMHKPILAHAND